MNRKVAVAAGSLVLLLLLLASASTGLAGPARHQSVSLTILAEDIPAGLDWDGPAVGLDTTQTGIINLSDYLVGQASDGVNSEGVHLLNFKKFVPRLATSWSYDPKTLTWTFHLRKGVVGCNGATFNADDVLYTYARAKSVSSSPSVAWFLAGIASIKGFDQSVFDKDKAKAAKAQILGSEVTKVDDYTVKIKQTAPNALFMPMQVIYGLAILDKETMQAHATKSDPWSHTYMNTVNLPSFGPWCLDHWTKDSEFVVNANPNYYRGKPAIDHIVYRKVPQSSNRVAAIQTGAAQLVEHLTPQEFNSLKEHAKNVKVAGVFGNQTLILLMNWKGAPFDNKTLRRAIAYAIPYDQVIKVGYLGQARRWLGQIPSTYPGYHQPKLQFSYDPAKAAQLLTQAGYPGGKGLDKYKSAFQLTYPAERESTLGPLATVIRSALQKVGIPAELNPLPSTQFGDRLFVKKDLPLALQDAEKPIGVDAAYAALIYVEPNSVANDTNYSNATVTKLAEQAKIEPNPAKRNKELAQLQDILQSDVNWVPIVEYKTQWAFSPKLTGITWHPSNSVEWYDLKLSP
jgi:peptide/nickel transport system substrate-binding protein